MRWSRSPRSRGIVSTALPREEHLDDVGVQPHLDLVSDQPRRHRVDPLATWIGAPPPHDGTRTVYSGTGADGSGRRWRRSSASALGAPLVERLVDDRLDERHVRLDGREIAAAAQHERLRQRALEPIVRLLHHAILVRLTRLDARRAQPVVIEHRGEPLRQHAPAAVPQLVRRRREIVRAHHLRHSAERPQGALQPLDQRLERLAERQLRKPPAADAEHELEQQVRERLAGDGDAELPACVKSNGASRPGGCTCGKYTSCSGPRNARHSRTRRCSVRTWPAPNRPG